MQRLVERTYKCPMCNAGVVISDCERPVEMIAGQSGSPNVRIVTVAGEEIHRCLLGESPRTIRLTA